MAVNLVFIEGRMTHEPELKQLPSGTSSVNFAVACRRNRKDKDGNYPTDFINVIAFGKGAEFIAQHFHKGDPIAVTGSIQQRTYTDKEGNKRSAFEILSENVNFVEGNKKSESSNDGMPFSVPSPVKPIIPEQNQQPNMVELSGDDDLPF